MLSLRVEKALVKNRNLEGAACHNLLVSREEVCMSNQKSPQELFPNLFGARPAKAQPARPMSPSDMRLVQFLMRQMGTRRPAATRPASAPLPRPAAKAPMGRPTAPSRPTLSRPLPRAAQR
jgi:hypothetical protein